MRQCVFHFVLMPLGKGMNLSSSLELCVNSRADWFFNLTKDNHSRRKTLNSNQLDSAWKLTSCHIHFMTFWFLQGKIRQLCHQLEMNQDLHLFQHSNYHYQILGDYCRHLSVHQIGKYWLKNACCTSHTINKVNLLHFPQRAMRTIFCWSNFKLYSRV